MEDEILSNKSRRSSSKRSIGTTQNKTIASPVIIGLVVVASILIVGGLIWLGNLQTSNASATVDLAEFPAMGNEDAPVTIVEYSDYGCPHCRDYVTSTADEIVDDYVKTGKVRYIVHSFNLGRPETALAAEAAWCAADQDHFFEYQRTAFENFGMAFNQSNLTSLGEQIEGIDLNAFSSCLSSRTHQVDVETARRTAAQRGVSATPTFFINDQKIEGNQPFEVMQQIIEQELARAQ